MKHFTSLAMLLLLFVTYVHADDAARTIKVGAILPLSGAVAPWGARIRIGLEASNELQGDKFSFIFEDEGSCEAKKALAAYRKLVSVDKVKIIFLGCLSGTEAIAPVAKKDSVLLLSLGLLNDSTLASGAKLVNLATEVGVESERLSNYILREKPTRVAGIFFADAFGQEFSKVMSKIFEERGTPLLASDAAGAELESFKPLILRWKKLQIDLLITTLSDKQQLTLLREMKEIGFTPKIFSSYILECYAPVPADRVYFEGIKYTHPVNGADTAAEKLAVEAALAKREKPGQMSNINAFFAYDGLTLLQKGFAQCPTHDAACLYTYFTSLGTQHGVSGEMTFQSNGALTRPYGLKQVEKGEFVWLER